VAAQVVRLPAEQVEPQPRALVVEGDRELDRRAEAERQRGGDEPLGELQGPYHDRTRALVGEAQLGHPAGREPQLAVDRRHADRSQARWQRRSHRLDGGRELVADQLH